MVWGIEGIWYGGLREYGMGIYGMGVGNLDSN